VLSGGIKECPGIGGLPYLYLCFRVDLQDMDGEATAFEACSGDAFEAFDRCPEPFDPDEWAFVVFKYQTERARARAEVSSSSRSRKQVSSLGGLPPGTLSAPILSATGCGRV
jgi:hypothetical protein